MSPLCSQGVGTHVIKIDLGIIFKGYDNRVATNLSPKYFKDKVFDLISNTDDSHNSILFLGHNPELEELANQLILRQNAYKDFSFFQKFSTSAIVGLSFPISSWKHISTYPGKLTLFWTPVKQ